MNPKQRNEVASALPLYRSILTKVYEAEASPRTAIKAFCLRCVGYLRNEVTSCSSIACPLHAYRPYQTGSDDDARPAEGTE